jgi:hypothetical protein|tara:strand:+ start:1211 stop:1642 length:432 start_codon:yes stop_codon:yes gene_type:complete
MFAIYDYSNYENNAIVYVTLNPVIENDQDFDTFLYKWMELYYKKKEFIFIFDTCNVGFIPLKYSLRMTIFIKKLKKQPHQYLQKSIILINNNVVKHMLDFIFMLQPPVAPVFITNIKSEIGSIIDNKHHNARVILPGTTFLNL